LSGVLDRMPGMGELADSGQIDDRILNRFKAMIQSMTPGERQDPNNINASRRRRIARGSGNTPEAVADLIKRFNGMKQMMSVLGTNPGLLGNLPGFKQFAAMQKMKGMDPNKMFGDMMGVPGGGDQQMQLPKGMPRGYTPPGFAGGRAPAERSAKAKNKAKAKRKAAKKARKRKR
jgi:signal recognition particle subunit SRP54